MKIIITFLMLTAIAFSQTYDVGQTNANVATALSNALSYPDSDYVKRSEMDITPESISDSLLLYPKLSIFDLSPTLIQDSLDVKLNRSEYSPSGFDTTNVYAVTDSLATDIAAIGDSNFVLTSEVGSVVQAYDADLTTYAGITPSANVQSILGGANYAAIRSLMSLSTTSEIQTMIWVSKDSSLVPVTLGSGAFIMGNVADGWYEANYQTVLDTLAAKGSLNMTQMAALMSGESGTGNVVMSNSPTLVTPALGTPSALTLTNATGLPQSGVTNLTTDLKTKADTLCYHWGVMDTVTVGDLVAYKVESNITVVKVSAYGTADSVLFNIQERAAGTPTTAGDSLFASPMWANSTGKDSTSFTGSGGANFAKNTWIQPVITTGLDATRFGITVWYIKQSY